MVDTYRLKGCIVANGHTQRTLAHAIGINKNTLNLKLNGKACFDTSEVERICRELNINDPVEKCAIFLSDTSQNRDKTK